MARLLFALVCVGAGGLVAEAQPRPSLEVVLERLRAYQATYYQAYAATVATERYTQERRSTTVELESEFAMVRVPGSAQWLGFRDVLRMNGKDVTDRPGRLTNLFVNPTTLSLEIASKIAAESARFNIGDVKRSVNNPAMVLDILDPRHHPRFRFTKHGEDRVGRVRAWIILIFEEARPTIVRSSKGLDEPVTGRLWVDPANGTLLRASIAIDLSPRSRELLYLDVTFGLEPQLQMWLPTRMHEVHETAMTHLQKGDATYSKYRQFTVQSRIVSP
jgi:hypothetical protein